MEVRDDFVSRVVPQTTAALQAYNASAQIAQLQASVPAQLQAVLQVATRWVSLPPATVQASMCNLPYTGNAAVQSCALPDAIPSNATSIYVWMREWSGDANDGEGWGTFALWTSPNNTDPSAPRYTKYVSEISYTGNSVSDNLVFPYTAERLVWYNQPWSGEQLPSSGNFAARIFFSGYA